MAGLSLNHKKGAITMTNLENAKLNNEELEQVAGGSAYDLADDSRFLNSLNGSTDRYGAWKMHNSKDRLLIIENAWAKLGIGIICPGDPTDYDTKIQYVLIDGGKITPITQEQARQHAMEVTGHHMTYKEWHG